MLKIFLILLIFSFCWALLWFWFLKNSDSTPAKKADKNIDTKAKYKEGLEYLKQGKYKEAKACLDEALKASPDNKEVLLALGQLYTVKGKYDEALEVYEKVVKKEPSNIEGLINIGNIYSKQSKHNEALETLEKAKEISPKNTQILCSITKCKIELSEAESLEYKALVEDYINLSSNKELPNDFESSLAKLYAKEGQVEKALEHCKKSLEVKADDAETYQLLGLIQLIKKNFAEAKSNLSVALNFQPNNLETHQIFSYLLCNKEDDVERKQCQRKYFEIIEQHIKKKAT